MIWSITAEYRLLESDAADVAQTTWLRLLEHIDRIQYPDRVGSWLAATARNECLRSLAARKRVVLGHDNNEMEETHASGADVDERLLAAERDQTVREAMSHLPSRWQRLLEMLMADPPVSYTEISDQLGLPVGSIGPTRGRCLARLRVLTWRPAERTGQRLIRCLPSARRCCPLTPARRPRRQAASSDAARVRSRRYGRDVGEADLGERGQQAVGHEEERQRPGHPARLK